MSRQNKYRDYEPPDGVEGAMPYAFYATASTHMNYSRGVIHLQPGESYTPLYPEVPAKVPCSYCGRALTNGECIKGCGGEQW